MLKNFGLNLTNVPKVSSLILSSKSAEAQVMDGCLFTWASDDPVNRWKYVSPGLSK